MPSNNQAGVYASTLAYLNTVAAVRTDDATKVVPVDENVQGQRQARGTIGHDANSAISSHPDIAFGRTGDFQVAEKQNVD